MQKAGTAWLYDQLETHPDFWMPPLKELHFFDKTLETKAAARLLPRVQSDISRLNEARRSRNRRPFGERELDFFAKVRAIKGGPPDIERYAELFQSKGAQLSGDITPAYCYLSENTIGQISKALPDVKIVLLVRDPVDRCWSALNMLVRRGERSEAHLLDLDSLNALLRKEEVAVRSFPSHVWSRWSEFVPAQRMRYFFFDRLVEDAADLRAEVLTFLGADPGKASGTRPADYNRKVNRPKIAMPQAIRERLIEFFYDELLACAAIFGGIASEWPQRYGVRPMRRP
jgi:hypothetical protein